MSHQEGSNPTPEATESQSYKAVSDWLAQAEQRATLARRNMTDGAFLPPAALGLVINREIYQNLRMAYLQGCQAAENSEINGPQIPEGAGDNCVATLWNYYDQGFTMAARSRISNPEGSSKASDMKLPAPPKFTGIRDELEAFIRTLHVKFNMEASRFPKDIQKIAYASSFLEKDAKSWFTPYVDKDTGEIKFANYPEFLKELRRSFGDPNIIATAEYELEKLSHTGSIDLYYAKFKEYMDILQWTEGQAVSKFRRGLKPRIRNILVNRGQYVSQTNVDALYTLAREAENDLNIREQEDRGLTHTRPPAPQKDRAYEKSHERNRRSHFQPSRPAYRQNHSSTAFGTHSGPMDLNAAPKRPAKSGRVYDRLSKEEKESRFKKGQCFYCKETGHYASDCPIANAKKGAQQKNWRDNRKAMAASKTEGTKGVEKGKVVYSLGGSEVETKND
jgi:hypothetical protein